MTHDPYQTYQTVGAYPGLTNPFSSPYNAMQTSAIHGAGNPFAANIGVPFANPWQPNPFLANLQQHPFAGGGQHNPLVTAALQNPFVAAAVQGQLATALQNQMLNQQGWNPQVNPQLNQMSNPVLAQLAAAIGQQIGLQANSPYGQQQPYQQFNPQQQPYQQFNQQPYQQIGQTTPFGQQQPYQQQFVPQQQPYQQFNQQPYQQIGQTTPFGQQQVSPFSQFNTPLAPQSWVGQGLTGQFGAGQIHPLLLQAAARAIQTQGISPWGAF